MIVGLHDSSWKQEPISPTYGFLNAVAVTSTSNAWVAGYYGTSAGEVTFIVHWNGSSWS
jgi:uncharacterized membrane protein YagU involved in acid resistance